MDRENKKNSTKKAIIKLTPAMKALPAGTADIPSSRRARGATTGTIAPTACVPCIWTSSRVTGHRTAAD